MIVCDLCEQFTEFPAEPNECVMVERSVFVVDNMRRENGKDFIGNVFGPFGCRKENRQFAFRYGCDLDEIRGKYNSGFNVHCALLLSNMPKVRGNRMNNAVKKNRVSCGCFISGLHQSPVAAKTRN